MKFFELKFVTAIAYMLLLLVITNYAFYCMNQASNAFLALGILIVMFVIIINIYFVRQMITLKKMVNDITKGKTQQKKGE